VAVAAAAVLAVRDEPVADVAAMAAVLAGQGAGVALVEAEMAAPVELREGMASTAAPVELAVALEAKVATVQGGVGSVVVVVMELET